ncbi:hypothetical protein PRIC2_013963 [Phytophthora ramorum]
MHMAQNVRFLSSTVRRSGAMMHTSFLTQQLEQTLRWQILHVFRSEKPKLRLQTAQPPSLFSTPEPANSSIGSITMGPFTGRPEFLRIRHTSFFISAQSTYLEKLSHWVATVFMDRVLSNSLLSLPKSKKPRA